MIVHDRQADGLGKIFAPVTDPSQPALSLENVSVDFGGGPVLDSVRLAIQSTDVVAIVGPNGAGKTTMLNTICGVNRRVSTGTVQYESRNVRGMRPDQVARAGIARSFQHPPLIERETVLENIMTGAHLDLGHSMASQVLRPRRRANKEREMRDRAQEILEFIKLDALANHPISGLPYGTRKLIDIARSLIRGPKLLLLDEPTSGLDRNEQSRVRELLLELQATNRATIVLVEHHMDVVRAVATKVVGLQAGKVLATGTTTEVLDSASFKAAMVGRN